MYVCVCIYMYSVELRSVAFIGKLLMALIPRAGAQLLVNPGLTRRALPLVENAALAKLIRQSCDDYNPDYDEFDELLSLMLHIHHIVLQGGDVNTQGRGWETPTWAIGEGTRYELARNCAT